MNTQAQSLSTSLPLRTPALPPIASFAPALFMETEGDYSIELRDVRSDGVEADTHGGVARVFVAQISETFAGVELSYEELPWTRVWLESNGDWEVDMPGFDEFSADIAILGADWRGGWTLTDDIRNNATARAFQRAIDALDL
ncbi:hypothetical protein [Xanthomonas sp. NCPPB 2632]|uniref:hypothetical protein n=1 Tax=Xanthomonas sp. NCPPB 2632 TaxID=3240912 RepID=UPI003514EBE3